ncbi:cytosine permease [Leuconostoc lactis]|uniref:cytosine permease n=1 Tax=Leuconostoc lactis TaxID=1246 RepID=UPI00289AFFBE|nr:cytosine permease [Leuconostoc lactis]
MVAQRAGNKAEQHVSQMGFWDQLATWIGANANNGTWYMGGVLAALGFAGALGVILISGPLAYLFLALVGYMGYKMRASTMNLMRPAFGLRGSIGPSLINVIQFMGWAAVNTYIAAISVSYLLSNMFGTAHFKPGGLKGMLIGVAVMGVLHLISISLGQRSVRLIERVGMVLVILLVIWETIVVLQEVPLSKIMTWTAPSAAHLPFGKALDVFAAFNLAWVTAGADFTRFADKKSAATTAPFLGATIGLYWFAIVGAMTTIAAAVWTQVFDPNSSDPSTVAAKLGLGALALIVIMLTSTTANAVNLMAAGSALNNIVPKLKLTPSLWLVTIVATLMSFIPFIVGGFIETFIWFLDLIGMVLGPEIAILLADFFIVQKQNYDRTAFNQGTTYWYTGGFNIRAYIVWALSMGCYFVLQQVPVVVQTVGSNWLTMIFAAVVYVAVSRNQTKML